MENNSSFHFASVHPPSMPDPEATFSRWRSDWVLLDNKAYIADRPNATTVEGFTPGGQAVQVTFWLADPPGLSHLCVHCPGLKNADFAAEPSIPCWENDVGILQIRFSNSTGVQSVRWGPRDFFVFKADREHPSLRPLPAPPSPLIFDPEEIAVFPSADDGKDFHIAVLRPPQLDIDDYDLHTFSSKTWTWSTRLARLPRSRATGARIPFNKVHKVIVLEGDLLGFVDLWRGIIFCRVLDESPCLLLRHIWLPPPLPVNAGLLNYASQIRDVVCIRGMIKFVEIGNRTRQVLRELGNDPRHNSHILHDSDLEELANSTVLVDTKNIYVADGWSFVTYNRLIRSDCWIKGCEVDAGDVPIDNPRHLSLLPELSSSHSGKSTLNKSLIMSIPTLGMQEADVVYLMCKVKTTDETAWVLAINMSKKSLENLASFSTLGICYFNRIYRPYAVSKHINMAPRYYEVGCRVFERGDAKTVPVDTTIPVHGVNLVSVKPSYVKSSQSLEKLLT